MTPARDPKQRFQKVSGLVSVETSGKRWRHLGGIWEASGRHLGGIWEASGPKEARKRIWRKLCQNICVFLSKVARATVSRARERPDPHQVRSLCTKVGGRPGRGTFRYTHGYPYLAARTPQCTTVWGKTQNGPRHLQRAFGVWASCQSSFSGRHWGEQAVQVEQRLLGGPVRN